MNKYQNAKIYKIVSNVSPVLYYGSTCEKLSSRLAKHRASYKAYEKGTSNYVSSFELLKLDHYDIILVEAYPCDNKEALHARERHYIENFVCVNKRIPNRGADPAVRNELGKEYYEKNKQSILNKQKEYRLKNKDAISERASQMILCECGVKLQKNNKKPHERTKKHQEYVKSTTNLMQKHT